MIQDDTLTLNTISSYTEEKRIPYQVTIELLSSCNFQCIHCYIPEHNCAGFSYGKIIEIFEQLRALGTLRLTLTGGEILIRPEILKIIENARNMGFSVSLLSNASLVTEEIASKLASLYINCFSTTIFSLNCKINDYITGVEGSLASVLNGVSLLKKHGIPIEIKTPLMRPNKIEYRGLREFCRENEFRYIVSPMITSKSNGDSSTAELRLNDEEFKIFFQEVELPKHGNFEPVPFDPDKQPCSSIRQLLSIDCQGNVYPCNSFYYKVGNVYDHTLQEIWNDSEQYTRLNSMRNADLKECMKCDVRNFCTRCPGRALLEDGSMITCSSLDKRYALQFAEEYRKRTQGM